MGNIILKLSENISSWRELQSFLLLLLLFFVVMVCLVLHCDVISHCLVLQISYCISDVLLHKQVHSERLLV